MIHRWVKQCVAFAWIAEHHRHHKKPPGTVICLGAFDGNALVGVIAIGRPVAGPLDDGAHWEVTRLCTNGHRNAASFLLGKARRLAAVAGISPPLYSYLRFDEDGVCYRAAGWVPVAETRPRHWDSGNKSTRWLPGLYEPTTEPVARVRWEARW